MSDKPEPNHNVYILGAGFSRDAGLPLINNFLERMASAVQWLADQERTAEVRAINRVFDFRARAADAAYRINIDVDNIEDLFSLASASMGEALTNDVTTAIAATIDFARANANIEDHFHDYNNECLLTLVTAKTPIFKREFEDFKQTVPLYHLYAWILGGYWRKDSTEMRNTIITFNYDTVLEDALSELEMPFCYGLPESLADYDSSAKCNACDTDPALTRIYKLHGSINWGTSNLADDKTTIYGEYEDLRLKGDQVLLIPPTWRKVLGGQLGHIWEHAVRALSEATRIIIVGFSMPSTDSHFKYLLAAGLQSNISLRKFLFVNPGLAEENEQQMRLRQNLFNILRSELEDKGVVELIPESTSTYFLKSQNREVIKRSVAPACRQIEYCGEEFTKYVY